MALYARLNADLTAVVEERELDPQLVAQFIADNNPKASYWKPLNVDPQPTLGANQVLDGYTYTIGETVVTKSWNVRNLTAAEIDVKYIYDNISTIKTTVLAMESGSGTSAERLNRVEAVLGKLTRFVVGQILPVLFLLMPMVGKGALNFTVANSHGMSNPIEAVSGQEITLSIWVNFPSFTTRPFLTAQGSDGGYHCLLLATSSRFAIERRNSAGTAVTSTVTKDSSYQDRWVHLAMVVAGSSSAKLYIDGTEEINQTSALTVPTITRAIVGSRIVSGSLSGYAICHMSDAAIWSTNLTSAEISSLAAGQSANQVRPQSLVFYAPLTNIGPGGGSGSAINTVGPPVLLTNTVTQATTQPRIYR
jgi:hypothetical protein